MTYSITYIYRLSDFVRIAQANGLERLFLTSVWVKSNRSKASEHHYQWRDVHELGFMGAFGLGFKMHVDGGTHVGSACDNRRLWEKAKAIEYKVRSMWRELRGREYGDRSVVLVLDVHVIPGTVIGTDVVGPSLVPYELFIEDRVPEIVPVYDFTRDKPERSSSNE